MKRLGQFRSTGTSLRISAICVATFTTALAIGPAQYAAAQTPKPIAPPANPTPITAPSVPAAAARPLTITDILAMQQAGLGDAVIIESIHQNRMAATLGAAELISMRQHGISNEVIQAMQQEAPLPAARPAAATRASAQTSLPSTVLQPVVQPTVVRPTIVEPVVRPVIVAPPIYAPVYRSHVYYGRPYHHHHHHHPVPYRASSFGIHVRF